MSEEGGILIVTKDNIRELVRDYGLTIKNINVRYGALQTQAEITILFNQENAMLVETYEAGDADWENMHMALFAAMMSGKQPLLWNIKDVEAQG